MKIIYGGDLSGVSGYARCSRGYVKALLKAGVDLYIQDRRKEQSGLSEDDSFLQVLKERTVPAGTPCDVFIQHETPQFWSPRDDCFNIGYTTFETTGIPNRDLDGRRENNWVAQCNRMNMVMVPSEFNKRTFKEYGVTVPIEVIPHVVTTPDPKSLPIKEFEAKPGHFRLLSIFQWNIRKDPLSLIIAYYRSGIANSRLILKTYGLGFDHKNMAIVEQIKGVKGSFYDTPVGIVNPLIHRMDDKDIDRLYYSADCHITTTRGEGFGLTLAESSMAGLPQIGPNGTALEDIVDDETGYPVTWSWEPVSGMHTLPYGKCYSPCTDWMKVNVDSVVLAIKAAYRDSMTPCTYRGENTTVLKVKGMKARDKVMGFCSEEKVIEKYLNVLRNIPRTGTI